MPLIRRSAISLAISLYGVMRSTLTTFVVITSLTRRAHRWCGCAPSGCGRLGAVSAAGPLCFRGTDVGVLPGSPKCSSTLSSALVTSDRVARPCSES